MVSYSSETLQKGGVDWTTRMLLEPILERIMEGQHGRG